MSDVPAELRDAARALAENRPADAELQLRRFLDAHPNNPNALNMLADVAIRFECFADAEGLLGECLAAAPKFFAARHRYANLLFRLNKAHRALAELDKLLAEDPDNFEALSLQAVALARIGDYGRALACHERLIREHAGRRGIWLNYASDLKAAGKQGDSIKIYREALARFPDLAEAYWSLGNLKTFRFAPADLDAMRALLEKPGLGDTDRCLLHFTLGKVAEDAKDFDASFAHYEKANALRHAAVHYDAERATALFARMRELFTSDFFARHDGTGFAAPDPIFIVGLPRAGSTLIEQILSSHSEVEATMELPNVTAIIERLDGPYPDVLDTLEPEIFEALGEEYVEDTRAFRKSGRPFFIDKMPENFRHIALIHLILPNAKIVDARRHPLACGISNFRQDFETDYGFTYDLEDLGRYYRDYVELMAHFDRVLPGKIHRVFYERMIEDPEAEIRALLDYLGLPFEEQCLRFYENDRPVLTASSEQVRSPIFKTALEQWRNYEKWLGPLKISLGAVLSFYPDVPPFT